MSKIRALQDHAPRVLAGTIPCLLLAFGVQAPLEAPELNSSIIFLRCHMSHDHPPSPVHLLFSKATLSLDKGSPIQYGSV